MSLSYTRSLATILKGKDSDLFARLTRIEDNAKTVLTYTAAAFPFFTPHDFPHSKKVEDNLNWLIPEDVKLKLNAHEIFFLIVAAWLHDWGMVCSSGERAEEIRPLHHVRSETNLEKMYDKVGLDRAEARIIGRIARGHRLENLRGHLFDDQVFSTNIPVRVRFLSAILRLADECDITYSRVPELLYYSLNPVGASKEHFDKHLNIGGIGKGRYGEHKIVFNAVAWDPKGSETLKAVRDKIQRELDEIKGILVEEGVLWEFVEANIDAKGFIDRPISFRLDQANVTQILIGEALYSRKDVAIRELLQNSVDSCKLQKSLHPTSNISIRIYREDGNLVVEDDGAGMDFESAFEFLSNKGVSYYQSEEFRALQKERTFDPISRWGLGILSCFLVSDEFDIETKKDGKDACRFAIRNAKEGWRYEQGARTSSGTRITLGLNDYGKGLDIEKTVRYYVKDPELPIFIGKGSSKPSQFDWTETDEIIQTHIDRCLSEIIYSSAPIERPRVTGQWTSTIGNLWVRWLQFSGFLTRPAFLVANQGFFVGKFDEYPLGPLPQNCIVLVNAKKDILDLSVSRENLRTDTKKSELFKEQLTAVLIEGFKKDLDEYTKEHLNSIGSEFKRTLTFHAILSHHELNPEDYVEANYGAIPKCYKEFLYKEVPFHVVSSEGHKVATLAQIMTIAPEAISFCSFSPRDLFEHADYGDILASGIELTSSILKDTLPQREVTIFASGIPIGDTLQFYSLLLKDLGSSCQVTRLVEFDDLVLSLKLEPNDTELDPLLPRGSRFASLPPQLRGGVICRKPARVKSSKILDDPFGNAVARALSREMLGLPLRKEFATFTILELGSFLFDSEGNFSKELIKNAKRILSDKGLCEITKNYFRLLAVNLFAGLDSPDLVEAREREISDLLGIKYPLESNRAILSRIMMPPRIARRSSRLIQVEYEPGVKAGEGGMVVSKHRL